MRTGVARIPLPGLLLCAHGLVASQLQRDPVPGCGLSILTGAELKLSPCSDRRHPLVHLPSIREDWCQRHLSQRHCPIVSIIPAQAAPRMRSCERVLRLRSKYDPECFVRTCLQSFAEFAILAATEQRVLLVLPASGLALSPPVLSIFQVIFQRRLQGVWMTANSDTTAKQGG